MENLKKIILALLGIVFLLSSQIAYATTEINANFEKFSMWKYVFIGIAVILIILIFVITYKIDKSREYYEEDEEDEDEKIDVSEDQSLYSSFNMEEEKGSEEKFEYEEDKFQYEDEVPNKENNVSVLDFQFDEIFDEELPEVQEEVIEAQEVSKLEEDFLMQMNKNLERKTHFTQAEPKEMEEIIDLGLKNENEAEIETIKVEEPKKRGRKKETEGDAKKKAVKKTTKKSTTTKMDKPEETKKRGRKKVTTEEVEKKTVKKSTKKKSEE